MEAEPTPDEIEAVAMALAMICERYPTLKHAFAQYAVVEPAKVERIFAELAQAAIAAYRQAEAR